MGFIDKKDILKRLTNSGRVKLELGCGPNKRDGSYIGIDLRDLPGVDIVGDVFEVFKGIPDNTVDEIYSAHFFEHVDNLELLLSEIHRILKPGGEIEIIVPHFSNPYFYSDHSHKTNFGLYSLSYFSVNQFFSRSVPRYDNQTCYFLQKVDLIFKSARPFYFRYGIKKIIQFFVNLNNFTKEFYEENLCYIFPCYEIRYKLVTQKEKDA